jgi:hypothetical protein
MRHNMKIYGFFNSTKEFGDALALAIDETGKVLATHICSNESFAIIDLGMDAHSRRKHDLYHTAHPHGWTCEFVRIRDDRDNHAGLQAALKAMDAADVAESQS